MFPSAEETLRLQLSRLARVGWQSQMWSASSRQGLPQAENVPAPTDAAIASETSLIVLPNMRHMLG